MGKRPAFQFYPKDWMADPDLQTTTLSAQGLWILVLCVMHYADPYGHLVTKKGGPLPVDQLAKLTPGYTADQVDSLLAELGDAGVYSQTDTGVIYSRRMVADYEIYQQRRADGSRGGATTATRRGGSNSRPKGGVAQEKHPSSSSASSSATASADRDDDDAGLGSGWMVNTYRASDFAAFGEHERWEEYTKAAADLPPRSAPAFEIWLEE